MCGIVGFAGRRGRADVLRGELEAMCGAIRHRGPDGEGIYLDDAVGLAMRRLSIIDVEGSWQPVHSEDGQIQLVLNGEIYNYRELRGELAGQGHRFHTAGDAETVVHLYEEHGTAAVDRLRGMFAFALWDKEGGRLFAARDRLGIKPLYYWESPNGLVIGSELKAFLQLPDFARTIDRGSLARYLELGYVPEPASIFEGVDKLPPGHFLSWSREEGLRVERYWSPIRDEDPTIDEETATEELRRLLLESVRYRLIADVPLGAFLSGGIDSSSVVAAMAAQAEEVRTFSIGFAEAQYDESGHAGEVAAALGTIHTSVRLDPDADALLESLVGAFDEPFADSSAVPTLLVSELARRSVTVALSGDGGDELFAGYTRYGAAARRDVPLPRGLQTALGALARRLPHAAFGRNRLLELSRTFRGRYAGHVAIPLDPAEGGVARPEVVRAGAPLDTLLDPWFEAVADLPPLAQLTGVDLQTYLPGDILTKVDRMSMAVSLEARVPILDHHLVEFAQRIPSSLKIRDGVGKWIFRKAIRGLVPPAVLDHPKKGFSVPIGRWLRRELSHRTEALLRPDNPVYEFLEPRAVTRVVREHRVGRRDHSTLIWRILVLSLWMDALRTPRRQPNLGELVADFVPGGA